MRDDVQWSADRVAEALTWSIRNIGRITDFVGPSGSASGSAMFTREDPRPPRGRALTPSEITRIEYAATWQSRYLGGAPGPARVLREYLRAAAFGDSFSAACAERGWPRSTAYRALRRALDKIADGLNREGVSWRWWNSDEEGVDSCGMR